MTMIDRLATLHPFKTLFSLAWLTIVLLAVVFGAPLTSS